MEYHDRGGRDPKPQPKAEPEFKLRGAPGSPERVQQVMEHVQDPTLIAELAWTSVGTHLQNTLHQIRQYEASEYFDGTYPQEIADAFASSARMIAASGDPQLYGAFANELEQGGSDLTEYLPAAVEFAETEGRIENYGIAAAQEQSRLEAREQMLKNEYADIQRRTGPAGLAGADQLAQNLDAEGLLYHPAATEDYLRADLRVTAEQAKAHDRGLRQAAFLTAMDDEIARNHGPGSSWSDDEREKWESELRMGTLETINRAFGQPEDHADRAIDGMIQDDRRRATGKGALERGIDAEVERMNQHTRQGSPHLQEMAESNAREWRETHDESGHPTTDYDALGREHRRRG